MTTYLWTPPTPPSLPVHGSDAHMPVRRLFFVARNYHAHAAEMGSPVDKSTMRPAYFTKSPHALVLSGATIPYPPGTENFHYEMELVVALGAAGFRVAAEDAPRLIYGYAAGLDMTRRDLQQQARAEGLPWSLAKDGELTAVSSAIVPMPGAVLSQGEIALEVNGAARQHSDLSRMVWSVPELIAALSHYYHLQPGDLIYTGTPEGVGPVHPGDRLSGRIAGVAEVALTIAPPEAPAP